MTVLQAVAAQQWDMQLDVGRVISIPKGSLASLICAFSTSGFVMYGGVNVVKSRLIPAS